MNIVDPILGLWCVAAGLFSWREAARHRDKLPGWMPYSRAARLCVVLVIGGGVLASWQAFYWLALRCR
jgi:hypothetical protein